MFEILSRAPSPLDQAATILLRPSEYEEDPSFRNALRRVLYAGLRWGGAAGVVGMIVHLGTEIGGLGLPVAWGLGPGNEQEVFLLHDLFLIGLSAGAALLPNVAPTLRQGRIFAAGAALAGAAAFLHDNILHGTVMVEFVALLYMMVVIAVPFRPWQGLGIGVGIGGLLHLFATWGWLVPATQVQMVQANDHVLAIVATTFVATLASGVLYATRLAHHKERKEAQETLRRSRDFLRRTQRVAKVGGWEYDPARDVVFGTEELGRVLGEEPDAQPASTREMTLGRMFRHFAPGTRAALTEDLGHCLAGETDLDRVVRLTEDTDEPRWARVRGSRQKRDGDGARVVGTVVDITEQKKREDALRAAKEEAEAANRTKSAFLATMSHEIRTPLTSILGFAEAIEAETEGLEPPAQTTDLAPLTRFASLIQKSGQRLMDTLTGVLNLSRLEAEEMDLAAEPVNLAEQAAQIAEELRPQAAEKGLDLRVETGEGLPRAQADESGVQIVLRNLISNAIKYTDEGEVRVRVYRGETSRQDDETAVLDVEDTGIGMDPEAVGDLFEPFRQESEGFDREYEGTGLGLAVTKEAVEQMGGRIEVETEKGEGSRVSVQLPLAECSSAYGKPPAAELAERT